MSFNLYFISLLFSIGLSECRHCQTCIATGSKAICPFSKSKCFLLYGPSMQDNLDITLRGCNDMNREPVIYFNGKRVPIVDTTFYNPIGVICGKSSPLYQTSSGVARVQNDVYASVRQGVGGGRLKAPMGPGESPGVGPGGETSFN